MTTGNIKRVYSFIYHVAYPNETYIESYVFSNLQKAVEFLDNNYNHLSFERKGYHSIRRAIKENCFYKVDIKVAKPPAEVIEYLKTYDPSYTSPRIILRSSIIIQQQELL